MSEKKSEITGSGTQIELRTIYWELTALGFAAVLLLTPLIYLLKGDAGSKRPGNQAAIFRRQ